MRFTKLSTFALAVLAGVVLAAAAQAAQSPRIKVLSGRADLTSGGDALVAIELPPGVGASSVRVAVGGRDVTGRFAKRANGRFEGLVTGLANGRNVLSARVSGGGGASITIVGHPTGGPVFSGPQVKPWKCTSSGARDAKCNEPTKYSYEYKSSADGQLHSYDPAHPPSDVAMTTTDRGVTVPFVIRVETGYQDRDQYKIAVLYQPKKPWSPWAPQKQWNHKLLITHGASCGIEHQSGESPSVTTDETGSGSPTTALGRGFATMSTALDNAGHNCNLLTQAESLVMAKEHLVESYGELRYTIGTGCSGGSLVQQQVANAYPGVYQGILPQCSFPDSWSTGQQLAAYHLTRLYFEHPDRWAPGVVWTPDQIADVEGHPNHANVVIFDQVYWTDLGVPDDGCVGVPSKQDYNAKTNPGGVRCDLADYMINLFGPRPRSVWSAPEKKVGHGFAGIPLDDVGVQFGLEALQRGQITPEQFIDLNRKIGGVDIDIRPTAKRSRADEPALRNAYRSGAVNETNNLTAVPIIDLRGPDPGAFHDAYRSFTIRARLERQEGHFPKNHVIWFGQEPLIGDTSYTTDGLLAMDRWLAKVEVDHRKVPRSQKVAQDRPADVHDRCSQIDGVEQVSVPGVGPVCELKEVQTRFATPAMVAGESIRTDVNKCRLKPLGHSDYYPVVFTAAQWQALQSAFPSGVCDWTKRGVHQRDTIPWQTYQDAHGHVIYGGRPLGRVPVSRPLR